jgi:hypothetical protein
MQREPVGEDPLEEASHPHSFFLVDFITPLALDIAIAERSMACTKYAALSGSLVLASPGPLEDLSALELGENSLDVEHQVTCRAGFFRHVDEEKVDLPPLELPRQQHCVRQVPAQAVRLQANDCADLSFLRQVPNLIEALPG